jgi:hypothetical protein
MGTAQAETIATPVTDESIIKQFQENKKNYSGFYKGVQKFFTGKGRTEFENLPELTSAKGEFTKAEGFKTGLGFALTPDINARMQIIQAQVPNAKFTYDKYNNPIVQLESGNNYYINKPGFSWQDLTDIVSEGVKYFGGGKFATKFYDPKSQIVKGTISQAGGAGAVSIGGDIAAKGLGAEDNIDFVRAGIVSGLTGAFVPVGAFGSAVWTKIFGNKKYVDSKGNFTSAGIKQIKKLGYNPEQFSESQRKIFQAYMSQGSTAKLSAQAVEDGAFGIPYYKAQLEGDKELLGLLERARKGVFGKDVQQVIMDSDAKQQFAMLEALKSIRSNLRITKKDSMGGKAYQAILDDDEAGDILIQSLKSLDDAYQNKIANAYNAVDQNAYFNGNSMLKMIHNANKKIKAESIVDSDLTPMFNEGVKKIKTFVKTYNKTKKDGRFDYATIKKIDIERRKLGQLIKNAENGSVDKKNLVILKKEFDQFFDDAVDQALFSGDEFALTNLKLARSLVKEHKDQLRVNDKFTKGIIIKDDAGRVINKIIADEITPEQALNYIFGTSALGSKDSALKIVKKLVGKNGIYKIGSPEHDALKQSAFNRIIGKSTTRDGFHPAKFIKNLEDAFEGRGKYIVQELFDEKEMQLFKDFSNAIEKTITPKDVLNPSGTADALGRLFHGAFEALAKIVGFKAAGMQGLIAAKILNARGRTAITQKKAAGFVQTIGDPPPGISSPTPKGILGGVVVPSYQGLLANEPSQEQIRGLLQ